MLALGLVILILVIAWWVMLIAFLTPSRPVTPAPAPSFKVQAPEPATWVFPEAFVYEPEQVELAEAPVVAAGYSEPTALPALSAPPEDIAASVTPVLIAAGWPEYLWQQAIQVVACESGGVPEKVGDGGDSVGLFQIGRSRPGWQAWFHYFGLPEEGWEDPVYNATVALKVYNYDIDRGQPPWTQWTCKPWS